MTNDQHLDRVEIRRFRGLEDLDLEGLGRFNLLLGENDVGKSSVLEAIFLLTGYPNLGLPTQIQNVRNFPVSTFDDLGTLFYNLDLDKPIEIVGHSGDDVRRSLGITAPFAEFQRHENSEASDASENGDSSSRRRAGRIADQLSSSLPDDVRSLRYDAKVQGPDGERVSFEGTLRVDAGNFHVQSTEQPAQEHVISARYIPPNFGYDGRAIGKLTVRKQTDRLVDFLKVINLRITSIAMSGDTCYVDIGLEQLMPLNMFGSGIVRASKILSVCMLGSERILLVEELENGLHHEAIRPFLKSLLTFSKSESVQVFASTHSLGVLEGLLDVLDEDDFSEHRSTTYCFGLHRDGVGRVRSYRYEHFQFEHCVRHGLEIR